MTQSLAYVHPEAKIGQNVIIEPFAYVAKDVEIGDGTWIGPHAVIFDGAKIGKNCRIFPGAVIAGIPQDLKFVGEKTTAEIGDNTTIRECVTVSRGTKAVGKTVVGSNCLIMAYSHVAHDCVVGDHVIMSNGSFIAGEVTLGDWAILSGGVMVHQFVHVGSHVFISGGSLVHKDVPPFVMAAREPLSYVGINVVGLRRRGFTPEQINLIQDVYRFLYQSSMNNSDALKAIEEQIAPSQYRDEIIDFVRNSSRGIMRGFKSSNNSSDSGDI
ncbi:MAG: acyl-ACP--UDP-N-acetylglucosamine O-acyltransferase [Bacteroidota bacterium]|nr:acyl-ACP--UDP-N-acetylglucosamine O-acyltransferase [Bacteroidota bacterium]MDP4226883.1 acyl-ACP--UDP-N-acetylglucosamine O-acyltransferase [Bacteroidota bacterium]MDP4273004.1 acyl-ACP--UDP-N-acetylglucosamine O-acyltransferase [Bacteroidota bacterium]